MPGLILRRQAAQEMMTLQLQQRYVGDVFVLHCSGRIVVGPEVEMLHQTIHQELAQQPNVVLDMRDIQFIDSSGLGTIVRLMSAARAAGGDLKLCQLPETIRKVLSMTNLHKVFDVFETEDEAIMAALRVRRPTADSPDDHSRPAILCIDQSHDVLAYLAELLRKEGMRPITVSNLVDAQVLMKARPPKLILANAKLSARGKMAAEIFAGCCPGVKFVDLGAEFSRDDAGEAGANLLAQVRNLL